uniref:Uncharacterized protein n=1 Tax=Tarenaya spinosa TaxID=228870 RepID=Q1KUT3_9ROSI|nr:hypothetical protein [Tarenaya spinosa]
MEKSVVLFGISHSGSMQEALHFSDVFIWLYGDPFGQKLRYVAWVFHVYVTCTYEDAKIYIIYSCFETVVPDELQLISGDHLLFGQLKGI